MKGFWTFSEGQAICARRAEGEKKAPAVHVIADFFFCFFCFFGERIYEYLNRLRLMIRGKKRLIAVTCLV